MKRFPERTLLAISLKCQKCLITHCKLGALCHCNSHSSNNVRLVATIHSFCLFYSVCRQHLEAAKEVIAKSIPFHGFGPYSAAVATHPLVPYCQVQDLVMFGQYISRAFFSYIFGGESYTTVRLICARHLIPWALITLQRKSDGTLPPEGNSGT